MNAITSLKRIAVLKAGGTPSVDQSEFWEDDGGIPWVSIGDMSDGLPVSTTARRVSLTGMASKRLPLGEPGTVLFAMYASVGAVAELAVQATWNQALLGIRPRAGFANSRFIRYWLQHVKPSLSALFRSNTQDNLNADQVGNLPFRLIPLMRQQQIVRFLDRETARIDTLIAKQKRLIQLLKEKRQAVISQAVTKGLDPGVPMKDSGVEWLGEVPAHWQVMELRFAYRFHNNKRTPIDRNVRAEMAGEYPYYGPTGRLDSISQYALEGRFFLLGEDGDHFLKFRDKPMTVRIDGKLSVNNHAHVLSGSRVSTTVWGALSFECRDMAPWLIRQGVGRYKLRKEVLADVPVLVPPLVEQSAIIERVEAECSKIRQAVSASQRFISLLQERRAALISAAVTGQIDVTTYDASRANKASAA